MPFYNRLVKLLKRYNLVRLPGQTQREFAGLVGGQLSEAGLVLNSAHLRDSAAAPRLVVEAYYRIRFGGEQLADDELQHIDRSLDRLETALGQHRRLPTRGPSADKLPPPPAKGA